MVVGQEVFQGGLLMKYLFQGEKEANPEIMEEATFSGIDKLI